MAATDPLCVCGIRGCVHYAEHASAYVVRHHPRRRRKTAKR